ncbi:MAG: SpoIIE family protein phosphatase [Bacteroidales bacterium]|nr:SpoIIE family protein phosphatase [Bacteroidales bacterium]
MKKHIKILYYLFLIIFFFFSTPLKSQQIIPLSAEKQQKVDEFKEYAEINKNNGDYLHAAFYYNKIAFVYWGNDSPRQAINYFLQSVVENKKINNFKEIKAIYSNIGVIYTEIEDIENAYNYFKESLNIRRQIGDKTDIASGLFDVAYILTILNKPEESNEKLDEALKISEKENNPRLTLSIYGLLAQNHSKLGNTQISQNYMNKYQSYKKHSETEQIKEKFEEKEIKNLAEIKRTQAEKRADKFEFELNELQFLRAQDSLNITIKSTQDSLDFVEIISREKQTKIDLLNKDKAIKELTIKEQKAKARNQTIIIFSGLLGFVLMILVLYVMYKSNKAKKAANLKLAQQNKEIEDKNDELLTASEKIKIQNLNITQSINYAKGIQQAMLPPIEELKSIIPESFILFKPRDVVSGDFYWFKEVDSKSNIYKVMNLFKSSSKKDNKKEDGTNHLDKKLLITAVDCTGHGVPGAFMSMIGYNLLDEIIDKGINRPDLILEEMHRGVQFSLKQETTENKDGMDMALCSYSKIDNTLEYSGAKNPLVYINNNEVFQIKGDKFAIGGAQSENIEFSSHKIEIKGPTWFYIFSDGFVDQFGGPDGRKFMIKKFRQLLLEIHQQPMEEQKEILDITFEGWKGSNFNQIDDILVMGFKLDKYIEEIKK